MQQSLGNVGGTTDHSPSKSGSTDSKGDCNLEADQLITAPMKADCCMTQTVTIPQQDDCHVVQIVANPSVPWPVVQAPATHSQSGSPRFDPQSPSARPNYISLDKDNNSSPARCTTRSASKSIMQETMLSCVDIYKPQYVKSAELKILTFTKTPMLTGETYTLSPKQMVQRRLPVKWLCKMANSVLCANRELLEHYHLIANQTTRATWHHSCGKMRLDKLSREC